MSVDAALVIHPGALGDVLQAVPALRALRRDGPVAVAAQPRLARLLHGLGAADAALSFENLGLGELFTETSASGALADRLREFARVVSWFGSRDARYPVRLGAIARAAVVGSPVPDGDAPVWRHLLASIGASGAPDTAPVDVPADWRARALDAVPALGARSHRPALLIQAGAGGEWKRWPAEAFASVIEAARARLGARILLHQGPADLRAVEQLEAALGGSPDRLVEPDLPLLAGVLAEVDGYLGGDSGVSQLAAAIGVPGVILYPAATLARWAPWCASTTALAMPTAAAMRVVPRAAAPLPAMLEAPLATPAVPDATAAVPEARAMKALEEGALPTAADSIESVSAALTAAVERGRRE